MKLASPVNTICCEDLPSPHWGGQSEFSLQNSVDLWRIAIGDHIPWIARLSQLLSEEELLRTARYHQRKDQIRFITGKGMLRLILADYLGASPKEIIFKRGFHNKPFVAHPMEVHFNVSYSNNWIIIAVSPVPLGVDIEYIKSNFPYQEIMHDCFTKEEREAIMASSLPQHQFFRLWTRKEALVKATSQGLDDNLRDFSCLNGVQQISAEIGMNTDWWIKSFLMEEEYFVSLALNTTLPIKFCDHNFPAFFNKETGN